MTGGGEVGGGGGRVLGTSIEDCTMLNARLDCSPQGFLLQFGPSVLFPQGFVQYSSFVEGMLVGKGRILSFGSRDGDKPARVTARPVVRSTCQRRCTF